MAIFNISAIIISICFVLILNETNAGLICSSEAKDKDDPKPEKSKTNVEASTSVPETSQEVIADQTNPGTSGRKDKKQEIQEITEVNDEKKKKNSRSKGSADSSTDVCCFSIGSADTGKSVRGGRDGDYVNANAAACTGGHGHGGNCGGGGGCGGGGNGGGCGGGCGGC